jgi:hypothetical protein
VDHHLHDPDRAVEFAGGRVKMITLHRIEGGYRRDFGLRADLILSVDNLAGRCPDGYSQSRITLVTGAVVNVTDRYSEVMRLSGAR